MAVLNVIILTKNEEIHIRRCIESFNGIPSKITVVDSFSTDKTKEFSQAIAHNFLENEFHNQSQQFNWALQQIDCAEGDWVFRIDADEYLTATDELSDILREDDPEIFGYSVVRKVSFLGQRLRFGKIGSQRVVRMFRFGFGCSEQKTMDEHILVNGHIAKSKVEILDDCKKGYDFWIKKHLSYTSRQVMSDQETAQRNPRAKGLDSYAKLMRYGKFAFDKLPAWFAIPIYFLIRYVVFLGFLDGRAGFWYAFNQVIWYRTAVEIKRYEDKVKRDHS